MAELPRKDEHGWPIIHFNYPVFCRGGHELPNPSPIFSRWSKTLIYVACDRCRPAMCVPIDVEEMPAGAVEAEGDGG